MGISHCEAQPKQSINELDSMDCHAHQAALNDKKEKDEKSRFVFSNHAKGF